MRGERPAPFVRQAPRERPPPAAPALPADPAQRERAQLLRAFESSPLSKANFCVLKRISEAELDAQLAQARAERG
jgi:ProP effector